MIKLFSKRLVKAALPFEAVPPAPAGRGGFTSFGRWSATQHRFADVGQRDVGLEELAELHGCHDALRAALRRLADEEP